MHTVLFVYQIFINQIFSSLEVPLICIAYISILRCPFFLFIASIFIIIALNVSRGIITALKSRFANPIPKLFSGWSTLVVFYRIGQIFMSLLMLTKFFLYSTHCELLYCGNFGFSFIPLKSVDIFILVGNYICCTENNMFFLEQHLKYQLRFLLFVSLFSYMYCFRTASHMHGLRVRLKFEQSLSQNIGSLPCYLSFLQYFPLSPAAITSLNYLVDFQDRESVHFLFNLFIFRLKSIKQKI